FSMFHSFQIPAPVATPGAYPLGRSARHNVRRLATGAFLGVAHIAVRDGHDGVTGAGSLARRASLRLHDESADAAHGRDFRLDGSLAVTEGAAGVIGEGRECHASYPFGDSRLRRRRSCVPA